LVTIVDIARIMCGLDGVFGCLLGWNFLR